ncbi:MAG: hypothetical protein CMJ78_05945, partial [Planctomycetaceae bacterium]|nr:hypothetical protein [Planctomycetaceae bacterium]
MITYHWDGLNTDLREVVLSSALGDGATPDSLPLRKLKNLQSFIVELKPPEYPWEINERELETVKKVFTEHCANCHANDGAMVNRVIGHDEVGTDRHRIEMWTKKDADAYNKYAHCYSWDF